jgi:hypothetical protein
VQWLVILQNNKRYTVCTSVKIKCEFFYIRSEIVACKCNNQYVGFAFFSVMKGFWCLKMVGVIVVHELLDFVYS